MKPIVIFWTVAMMNGAVAQIAWTPIFVDGSSQVDLWTQSSTGCSCRASADADTSTLPDASTACACCVREGACSCGMAAPARCVQCGLEQHCSNMCNITIDSRVLKSRSGKTFGQIKSPSMEGPGSCSYMLQPDTGQRVEIQVYRLVSVGRFNGSSCVGGHLQLVDGAGAARAADTRLCGANERYTPPVVLFADHGASSLIFKITEKTARSQFLAYFSFTSLSNKQGVGYHPRGGSRIPNTDCDWMYADAACRAAAGGCVLASPGYPGLYPPHRRCRYLLATSSAHTRVRITFLSILLPNNHCTTDYLSLYAGGTTAAPRLATLCEERRAELEHAGPNLLLEFNNVSTGSSGPQVPPFDYNGFLARLEFLESPPTAVPSVPPTPPIQPVSALMDGALPSLSSEEGSGAGGAAGCGMTVSWRTSRSGHFDTRARNPRRPAAPCVINFVGGPTDVVHLSIFNFHLKSPSCRSVIDIREGTWGDGTPHNDESGRLLRVCSPALREARDALGRFVARHPLLSRGSNVTVSLRRSSHSQHDEEFLDGAYMFHDEGLLGTLRPGAACDTSLYGVSAPSTGAVLPPAHHHLFWNVEGSLRCRTHFLPVTNQSVTIKIEALGGLGANAVRGGAGSCVTSCGDAGCRCEPAGERGELADVDHLAVIGGAGAGDEHVLACLCGDFQPEWLPISVRGWSSLRVEYSVAHYTYTSRGFDFRASYRFDDDSACGQRTYTTHSGEILAKDHSKLESLNYFYYQDCTWTLDSNVERQLFIEISTNQSRPCVAWNVSIHEWGGAGTEGGAGGGQRLHTFCPRDLRKLYTMPWRLNTVVIKVLALTRTQPMYSIRWRSQVVRATRLGSPTPAPAASKGSALSTATILPSLLWTASRLSRLYFSVIKKLLLF